MEPKFEDIDPSKYVTLPIEHDDIWELYQATLDTFWTAQDINMTADIRGFDAMPPEQQEFIVSVMTVLFLIHKSVLDKQFFISLMNSSDIKEASYFLGSQADTKKTHQKIYAMAMDELCLDRKVQTIQSVAPKHLDLLEWISKSLDESRSYSDRMLSFLAIQGIFLSGLIRALESMRSADTMPGVRESNRLVSRDTQLHVEFLIRLFRHVPNRPSEEQIVDAVREAVNMTQKFLTESEPVAKIGMTNALITEYIEKSADTILVKMGLRRVYRKQSDDNDAFASVGCVSDMDGVNVKSYKTNFSTAEQSSFTLTAEF